MNNIIPKIFEYDVVFREFPNETTLALNFTCCPCHCEGCHSSHLANDIGKELTVEFLTNLLKCHDNFITCVGLMGGDAYPDRINKIAKFIKSLYPDMKVGWYSGRQHSLDSVPVDKENFDYIKVGPYIKDRGPLNDKNTNQVFWTKKIINDEEIWEDTTKFFQEN